MAYLSNKLLLLLGWLAVMMVLLNERPSAHVDPPELSWYELSRVLIANEDPLQVYRETHPARGLGKPVRAKGGGTGPGSSSNKISLAIVRPFANGRAEELVASFADWEAMTPSKDGCANHEIGLILTFPREGDPQGYADVYDAYEKIKEIGQRTNGWGGCIKSIDLFFAGLTVEEDFYSSYFAELGGVQNWVNGPNRQFERVFRFVQSQKKYDLWYLMEPDVFPQKNYWLDNLLEEITVAQPGLILTFPREGDPQRYADVYAAYEKIKEMSEHWGCIKSVDIFFAGLTVEEDTYSSYFAELGGVLNWVNGPNRQFERVFRYVQSQTKYDLWYLMEPDVFPQKNYWLDNLLEEITVAQPFAILGAKYLGFRTTRGEFRKVKNLLALHHINGNAVYNVTDPLLLNMISEFENEADTVDAPSINGNAVYNVTDPLLLKMISEFEDEADTVFNAIPYDVRLSQMMIEGGTGVAHPPALLSKKGYKRVLPSKLDKLTGWYNEHASIYAPDDPVKESNVMSNMADYMLHQAVAERYSLIHDSSRKPGKFGRPINMKQ
eukprot:CAMPEP_0183743102 /NCGR_PEP_ID=MMETSP0737-20130205/65044_1 /TAXON_ID=385413 /ORGANISM="Thalassiosira miniscula, Strain CCMP1093" /LENGTH=550 /DNA_ID=CAMNT_0025978707 /DNA_START=198 /DNA_END=1851 /DNA_ORIENTATION=+